MALMHRVLVCFPAAVRGDLEPPLADLVAGIDDASVQEHLARLSAIPNLDVVRFDAGDVTTGRAPYYALRAPGGEIFHVRRRATGRWHLAQ